MSVTYFVQAIGGGPIKIVDCGARPDDPRKLHFDHRPGTVKLFQLARACYSWPRMIAELEKCDVRCISCHSTRHWADKRSRP